MCCLAPSTIGTFVVTKFHKIVEEADKKIFHFEGFYNRTPAAPADRLLYFFERLELVEKIAEIADECFHLFGSLCKRYANAEVYQTLSHLHHGAHHIEHVLHSFCFLHDVIHFVRFLSHLCGHDDDIIVNPFTYLSLLARISYAFAHFLATIQFLDSLKLCRGGALGSLFKYAPIMIAIGDSLSITSLIWQCYEKINRQDEEKDKDQEKEEQLISNIFIYLSGLLFEILPFAKNMYSFTRYSLFMTKAASIAGIIHAWFIVQRLTENKIIAKFEEIEGKLKLVCNTGHHDRCDHIEE